MCMCVCVSAYACASGAQQNCSGVCAPAQVQNRRREPGCALQCSARRPLRAARAVKKGKKIERGNENEILAERQGMA